MREGIAQDGAAFDVTDFQCRKDEIIYPALAAFHETYCWDYTCIMGGWTAERVGFEAVGEFDTEGDGVEY